MRYIKKQRLFLLHKVCKERKTLKSYKVTDVRKELTSSKKRQNKITCGHPYKEADIFTNRNNYSLRLTIIVYLAVFPFLKIIVILQYQCSTYYYFPLLYPYLLNFI